MPGRRLGVGSHRRLAGRIPGRMLGGKTVLRDQKPADLRKKGPPGEYPKVCVNLQTDVR